MSLILLAGCGTPPWQTQQTTTDGNTNTGDTNTGNTNHAPVISSLIANPATVSMGGTSTLTCQATDEDNDPLTYTWSADSGTIVGNDSTATWTAPTTAGTYSITCKVSDAKAEASQQVSAKAETANTWQITGFNEISTVLISGENIILVGESNSNQKVLKAQKRLLADPNTIVWTYENTNGVLCRSSNNNIFIHRCGAVTFNNNIYILGISETSFQVENTVVTEYDLAWRILKINSNGELVWDQKSDQTYHDTRGEYPVKIVVNNSDEVYILGDQGVISPSRTRRLEKRNGITGELIWSTINSYIWPGSLAIDKDKIYVVGDNNFLVDPMDGYGILEAVDNLSGALLWLIQYNPIQAKYSSDFFNDIGVYNDLLYIIGPRGADWRNVSWQINKRSAVDGSLITEIVTNGNRSSFTNIFVDENGIYVVGGRDGNQIVEKYDNDLNLVWSKEFDRGLIMNIIKNEDRLYFLATDGDWSDGYLWSSINNKWYFKTISSFTGS